MNRFAKNLLFYILLILVLFSGFGNLVKSVPTRTIAYSEFLDAVEADNVRSVVFSDNRIVGEYRREDSRFVTFAPKDDRLVERLAAKKIEIKVEPPSQAGWVAGFIFQWILPLALIAAFWIFLFQRMDGGNSKAMSFGKSKAKLFTPNKVKETFKDVAGCDEAKAELAEVVDYLRDPDRYRRLGGRIPKGVLLVGPPGTGKTLLARAVAGEAGVPFFNISGSDFVEMFVGVGASRVRDLFHQGKKAAPCILFIDELDAVGRQRGTGLGGGHDEREQTLNQLLVEMDGFEGNDGIILLSATNRPDVLDPALLRPGRFDREITVDAPDLRGRLEILKVHTAKTPLSAEVNLEVIARGTPGMAGADLANLVNEAALVAARGNGSEIRMADFESAKDKIMMGLERRSKIIPEDERRVTAYHEAGHALVSKMLPGADPVHKVTIIPRGRALGVTHQLPERDRYHYSADHFADRMAILLAGRAAEELVFARLFTGAEHDLSVAAKIAHNMVCSWGMSEMGPVALGRREEHVFLGRELSRVKDYSEYTARRIDREVAKLVTEAHARAKSLVEGNAAKLHAIAAALLERETITGEEIDALLAGLPA